MRFDINKTLCFTGNRPEKMPDGGDPRSEIVISARKLLRKEIVRAVDEGFEYFITGMAEGVDMWAGEIVADLMCAGADIHLMSVFPYNGYRERYIRSSEACDRILAFSDETLYLSESYFKGCMFVRNKFMVDNSSCLIAVINEYKGGAGQTLGYAKSLGKEIRLVDIGKLLPDANEQTSLF